MVNRLFAVVFLCLLSVDARAAGDAWLRIDTRTDTLAVIQHGQIVEKLTGIAIGRGGVTRNRLRGDERTPLGQFRIGWINDSSPFHRFYGLDYPNRNYAQRAYRDGLISRTTFERIVRALRDHSIPPQNTPLGGYVGIHGLGHASVRIHRLFNWTRGCVALTNGQIDRLASWIVVGTKVVIE
ncbi:MAG: L,D-transpeptidase [Gammaproteobacteria bacterium]